VVPNVRDRSRRKLPAWLDRAVSIAVLPTDSPDVRQTKRLLTGILWATIPATALSMVQFAVVEGAPEMALVVLPPGLTSIVTLLIVSWRPTSYPHIAHLPVGVTLLSSAIAVALGGGFLGSAGNAMWGIVAVLGAAAVFGDRRATAWLWVFIVAMVASSWIGAHTEPVIVFEHAERAATFNFVAVTLFIFFMVMYYVRQRTVLLGQSERLLRNILPSPIAERLKAEDGIIADDFAAASVLFADVVGFTPMTSDMTSAEVVGMLDEVFSEIDRLVDERGLEKIKTIGDEYMVAAGVPEPREDHAEVLCDLALALRDMADTMTFSGRRISFRTGINSGAVVAGIIGVKKFSYDLWGDAVNVASRMETSSLPGEIQITATTLGLVSDVFLCEPKGMIDVKGKGEMDVWLLISRR
jgi:guanylate cyclase